MQKLVASKKLKHSIFIVDEKDLQNATTDIIEITGENQTRTPVYTTTDTTESTSETQTSTPIHTTEKSSECHEDKLERNYGERGEISSEDKSTDGSIRKTSTSDDEDTIKGNNAGETTSRNVSIH